MIIRRLSGSSWVHWVCLLCITQPKTRASQAVDGRDTYVLGDFLLGFAGSGHEAEQIKLKIRRRQGVRAKAAGVAGLLPWHARNRREGQSMIEEYLDSLFNRFAGTGRAGAHSPRPYAASAMPTASDAASNWRTADRHPSYQDCDYSPVSASSSSAPAAYSKRSK